MVLVKDLKSRVGYSYSEGCLVINLNRKPLLKLKQPDRISAMAFAKNNQEHILASVAKYCNDNGLKVS